MKNSKDKLIDVTPIAYNRTRIYIGALHVAALESSPKVISNFEITDEQTETAHAHVIKKFNDFVLKDEEKYDYLMRRYFEEEFDFSEKE